MSAVIRLLMGAGAMVLMSILSGCDETGKTEVLPVPQNAVPSRLVVDVRSDGCYGRFVRLDASNTYDPDGGVVELAWEVAVEPAGSEVAARLEGMHQEEVLVILEKAGNYRLRTRATGKGGRVAVSPWMNFQVGEVYSDDDYPATCQLHRSGFDLSGVRNLLDGQPGEPVRLDAPVGGESGFTYRWWVVAQKDGSAVALTESEQQTAWLTADSFGSYSIALEISRDGLVQAGVVYRVDMSPVSPSAAREVAQNIDVFSLIPGSRTLLLADDRHLSTWDIDSGATTELDMPDVVQRLVINPSGTRVLVGMKHGVALVDLAGNALSLVWNRSLLEVPYQYYLDARWLDDDRALLVTRLSTSYKQNLQLFRASDQTLSLVSDTLLGDASYSTVDFGSSSRFLQANASTFYWQNYYSGLRRSVISSSGAVQATSSVTFAPCPSSEYNSPVFLSFDRVSTCGILFSLDDAGVAAPVQFIDYPAAVDGRLQQLSHDGTRLYVYGGSQAYNVDLVSGEDPEVIPMPTISGAYDRRVVGVLSTEQVPFGMLVQASTGWGDNPKRLFFVE